MTDDTWLDPTKGPSKNEVAFDYLKSNDFRTIWADGAIGAITPNGHIHFALFVERQAIPRRQVFTIEQVDGKAGRLGSEVVEKQISRSSIVRELACDILLTPQSAENLALWLLSQVADFRKMEGEGQ